MGWFFVDKKNLGVIVYWLFVGHYLSRSVGKTNKGRKSKQ